MTWPDFISDKSGRKYSFRPTDREHNGTRYYEAYFFDENGEEAGYLCFDDCGDTSMYLCDMEVYEKFGGAGLGSALIRIVEEEAKRIHKKKIIGRVEARAQTSGKKERLAAWYQRLGYTVIELEFDSKRDNYGTLEKIL